MVLTTQPYCLSTCTPIDGERTSGLFMLWHIIHRLCGDAAVSCVSLIDEQTEALEPLAIVAPNLTISVDWPNLSKIPLHDNYNLVWISLLDHVTMDHFHLYNRSLEVRQCHYLTQPNTVVPISRPLLHLSSVSKCWHTSLRASWVFCSTVCSLPGFLSPI
jgi:hypothetical protein